MSSPSGQPWEDRRGMFQRGKELHDAARRPSQSGGVIEAVRRASVTSNGSVVDKPLSNDPAPPASPTSQRRRSSAASSGLFGSLAQHKRSSEDYAARRSSHADQLQSGGVVAGWFNKSFRGITTPGDQKTAEQQKRGVME
ncbi:hypothetical protein Slin14017_G022490 [Septoria linicola]|nr:hypothetical protein Slin14017_G022490 [Septoria linicola]